MAVRWLISGGGNFSSTSVWNDGALLGIPTTGDDVYTNGFTVNMDVNATVNSLNNSARARNIATPAMTANNAPSPFVAAASTQTSGFDPWRAFDRVYATNTGWATLSGNTTGWLSMDFGSGNSVVIDGYTIYGRNNQALNPRNWTLESSDDNTNWTIRHTVSGAAAIPADGSYSIASIGNTTGSRYYRINISLNGGGITVGTPELELYQPGTAALAAGGSFIFNSGSISGSATSTTAALTAGATNLIQVTATTGTVTLNLSSNVSGIGTATTQVINHSGNCDFRLNGQTFIGGAAANAFCINKSSTGLITVVGNLQGGTLGNSNADALNITNGNAVVTGSLTATNHGRGVSISTPTGILSISGSVAGGNGHSGILLSGVSSQFTIIGNVVGGTGGNAVGISHSGTSGTVIGNVTGGTTTNGTGIVTTGNITVTGNVTAGTFPSAHGINLTGASSQFTIVGNVTGGTSTSTFGISHSGTSGSVIGNVTGGSGTNANGINTVGAVTVTGDVRGGPGIAAGINTSNTLTVTGNITAGSTSTSFGVATTAPLTVIGNVNGNVAAGIQTTTSTTVTGSIFAGAVGAGIVNSGNNSLTVAVRGDVYSSATQNGIVLTGTGTQVVNLAGNMYNTLGRNAIWCPNIFISNAATSLWRIDTGGGNYKTLYSADSTPNLPPTSSVRNGITYGPALALTGTMVVPSASNVRSGVAVDNTVGTGELTSANVISGINASSDALAVRLKNALTDRTAGNLMSQFNNI